MCVMELYFKYCSYTHRHASAVTILVLKLKGFKTLLKTYIQRIVNVIIKLYLQSPSLPTADRHEGLLQQISEICNLLVTVIWKCMNRHKDLSDIRGREKV